MEGYGNAGDHTCHRSRQRAGSDGKPPDMKGGKGFLRGNGGIRHESNYNRSEVKHEPVDRKDREAYVEDVFTRIAPHYDLMNRLMTAGQDVRWRRETIRRAKLEPGSRLLDLGTGTGDLAREALRQQPGAKVTAADLTRQMMLVGKMTHGDLPFVQANVLQAPFAEGTFDAVVSGYLMRNVGDLSQAIAEQYRLLKPGGRLVILETTVPTRNVLKPFIWLHLHVGIPLLGRIISGNGDAYRYLPDSTEHFLLAEDLAARLAEGGFVRVGFRRLMGGTMAIHWAEKPVEN